MCAVVERSSSVGVLGTPCSQHRGRRKLDYIVLTWCLQVPAYCSLGSCIVLTSCFHGAYMVLSHGTCIALTCCLHGAYMVLSHGTYIALAWCLHGAYTVLTLCFHRAYMVLTWSIRGAHIAPLVLITWCLHCAYIALTLRLHGAYMVLTLCCFLCRMMLTLRLRGAYIVLTCCLPSILLPYNLHGTSDLQMIPRAVTCTQQDSTSA